MSAFEFRVVPAPRRGEKARGVRTTEERFALALTRLMNRMAADGWDYVRADSLPCEERSGLRGVRTTFQNMLVFRRPAVLPATAAGREPVVERDFRRDGATSGTGQLRADRGGGPADLADNRPGRALTAAAPAAAPAATATERAGGPATEGRARGEPQPVPAALPKLRLEAPIGPPVATAALGPATERGTHGRS